MQYIIRSFDSQSGQVSVEFPDLDWPVTMFLPMDEFRQVPTGEDLDAYIMGNKPSQLPPPLPITNADEIQSLVQPWPPTPPTWDQIRSRRNALLADSDWTQLPDVNLSESQTTAWRSYRQQLREIPDLFANPQDVVWPSEPLSES